MEKFKVQESQSLTYKQQGLSFYSNYHGSGPELFFETFEIKWLHF